MFSVTLAAGMLLGFKLRDKQGYKASYFFSSGQRNTVQEILNLIRVKYVDSLHDKDLNADAIAGILRHLDPHSLYIAPSRLSSVNEDLEGNFQGIGIEFNIFSDTVNVISVISGGPSQEAGLQTGDKIVRVGDSLVAGNGITADRIRELLRGPKGSAVKVTLLRDGQLLPVEIHRGIIPLHSIDAGYMATPDVGYIRINRFAANTYREFMDTMLVLQQKGLKKLIIDLRQNPGGYLDAATKIADELLSDDKLIVYTQGKSYPRTDYRCDKPGIFEKGNLALLVDEGSASASEILSGAVQDWDRGTIIGRRTFGKGLVQEQFPLYDGGALRLTVARYYIPSGRCIQKSYKKGIEDYDEDILHRYQHGELSTADSIHFADTTHYYTRIKHRVVYGGGGITPDVFVPLDTTHINGALALLYTQNTLYNFVYAYYSRHRKLFDEYQDAADFSKRFHVSDDIMQAFRQYARKEGKDSLPAAGSADEPELRERLKAFFARQRWSTEGYYEVSNAGDPMLTKALEQLGG
ncbi:S41 family peptidase [Compostibacter hankyongensis]|uniref:S41 family peptidase n=1 Tax=Compostibacter hankyongensis TaxID=1007089 RepID=A0ABP8FHT0_9BACT